MAARITTTCPACKAKLAVNPESAGKRLRCPKCRGVVLVPRVEDNAMLPSPSFDFTQPPDSDEDDVPINDEYQEDPYTNRPQTFRRRTSELTGDFSEEIIQENLIPPSVARIVSHDEQFLFAGNPSHVLLIIRLILNGFLSLIANPFILLIPIVESTTNRILLIVGATLWISLFAYLTYIAWRTTFFGITPRRIIVRTGWFSHIILMAPVHNIQMVTINTGFIDQWLGLNSVCFATGGASGFGFLRSGVLVFANIHSDEVMNAYSRALGRQTN
jgi:membrane protein YdbS with pleckstrin-like domain/Zn-finger nucleic acid-binding protein